MNKNKKHKTIKNKEKILKKMKNNKTQGKH